jgi:tetratricopeptide (TPR) repeat protein
MMSYELGGASDKINQLHERRQRYRHSGAKSTRFSENSLKIIFMSNPRLESLMALHAESEKDTFVLFAIAKEHEKLGQKMEALAWFERLKAADPNYVGLYYHLGKLLESVQRFDDAIVCYTDGMLVARKAGDAHAFSELAGAKMNLTEDE